VNGVNISGAEFGRIHRFSVQLKILTGFLVCLYLY